MEDSVTSNSVTDDSVTDDSFKALGLDFIVDLHVEIDQMKVRLGISHFLSAVDYQNSDNFPGLSAVI